MAPTGQAQPAQVDRGGVAAAGARPLPLEYGPAPRPPRRWGTGFLPAAASLYLPGLGHLVAGRPRAAAGWFATYLALALLVIASFAVPAAVPALIVLVPLSAAFQLSCAAHAFRTGVRHGGRMLGHAPLRYLAGLGILVAPQVFHPALPVALFVREHLAEAFVVPTGTMAPTILAGDRVIAHKRIGQVRRWDLVVFDSDESLGSRFILRVAGLPGETIELVGGEVTVDGAVVPRPTGVGPYAPVLPGSPGVPPGGNAAAGNPMTLGPDEYFVLGDNSRISLDSRYWIRPAPGHPPGALPADRIVARVTTIYWPISRWRQLRADG